MNSENVFQRLLQVIQEYQQKQTQGNFVGYHEPSELSEILQLDKQGQEGDLEALFQWVEKYLQYAVKTAHPGYLNRMWAGANPPSVIGEIITAISNTSACTFETAPVSTLMEQYMLQEMLDLVGFKNGIGQMSTGSSNANMIVMMAARNIAFEAAKTCGLFEAPRMYAFVNKDAHYSMDRAAAILGIGIDNLVKVDTNSKGQMRPDKLEAIIQEVLGEGGIPFLVSATAGTTVRGSYDDLVPLLDLREKYGYWLHVDGAWGGAALLSETLRGRFLTNIEQVDSFTLDFHKMLGTALMCNVVLFNQRPDILRQICSAGDESYIFHSGAGGELRDLGTQSLQCGRKVDSLKWFLDWKFYGQQGLAQRVEKYLELCAYAEERILATTELEMVVPRESFNICFRHKPPGNDSADEFNIKLRNRMQQKERGLVGSGYVEGELVLRLLITNVNVGREEIDTFIKNVLLTAQEICKTM